MRDTLAHASQGTQSADASGADDQEIGLARCV
jgi:hypothetical protein